MASVSQDFVKLTRRPVVSGILIFVVLAFVGLIWYAGWQVLFTILLSWVMADTIISAIFKGGRGIFQISLLGSSTQPKGHAYLAFTIAIVLTTLISNGFAQLFADLTADSLSFVVSLSFFATLLVWFDLQLRFYWKQ